MFRISSYLYSTFNSRPHKEVDYQPHPPVCLHRPFNSRPHKEVDSTEAAKSPAISLSIHDLTRRSTCPAATSEAVDYPFNSRPHKEVDHITPLCIEYSLPFNSRPHKEVDASSDSMSPMLCLSIHDLTRRSTEFCYSNDVYGDFQFTTSQGGRRNSSALMPATFAFQFTTSQGGRHPWHPPFFQHLPFNSRPHKEVDGWLL